MRRRCMSMTRERGARRKRGGSSKIPRAGWIAPKRRWRGEKHEGAGDRCRRDSRRASRQRRDGTAAFRLRPEADAAQDGERREKGGGGMEVRSCLDRLSRPCVAQPAHGG